MKTLLVDTDAEWMARNIQEFDPNCQIVGAYSDTTTTFSDIQAIKPDVAVISLDMLEIDGFDLAKHLLKKGCEVIMISEWTTFAYEALRIGVIDYLIKPCTQQDLLVAYQRVCKRVHEKSAANPEKNDFELLKLQEYSIPGYITLSSQGTINLISIKHIVRYKSEKNHSLLVLENGQMLNLICNRHLLEQQLLAYRFVYANRNCLVNLEKVQYFLPAQKTLLMLDGTSIKVAKGMGKSIFQMGFKAT